MRFQISKCVAGLALLVLAACTPPIADTTADELESLSAEAVSLIGAPARVEKAINGDLPEIEQMCNYLSGQSYTYAVRFDAASQQAVSDEARQLEAVGSALEEYMDALVEAIRGESVRNLESAADGFGTSLNSTVQLIGVPPMEGPIDAAINYAARSGETARQNRIRAIMFGATDALLNLEALLRRDAWDVIDETSKLYTVWDKEVRCILSRSRANGSGIDAYQTFAERGYFYRQELASITRAPDTVSLLAEAHLEASDPDISFKDGMRAFVEILKEDKDLRRALDL